MTAFNLQELKKTAQNAESLTIFTKTSAPRVQVLAEDLIALIDRIEELEADIQRVRELHPPRPNSTSALYPTPLCACGKDYPCPTIQALEEAADAFEGGHINVEIFTAGSSEKASELGIGDTND